jgi:hypothetical protein
MDSTFSRMGNLYRIMRRTFGRKVLPIMVGLLWCVLRAIIAVGTFLQRFLADKGFGCGMELFMMLYPSLIIQKLFRPFLPLLEKISPAKFHASKVHDTSLSSVETDDVAVLFRYLDGFFLYGFFLAFDEPDHYLQFDPRVRDVSGRDFAWLEKLWRRSLVLHKSQRNVAKLFSLSTRLPQFLKAFPEAQVLYLLRDPLEIVPSTMSLVTGALDRGFGFWKLPDELRKRWCERLYKGLMLLLERFHEEWQSGAIDRSRVFLVRYDRMMVDFEGLMDEMCKFLGQEMTPALRAAIAEQGGKQRKHDSGHKYDLAKYGLTEAQVRRDFAFFYDAFLPPMQFPAHPAGKA